MHSLCLGLLMGHDTFSRKCLVNFGTICDPMRWGNRLLYNNDKLKPYSILCGVKVTSVQAIWRRNKQTKVVELVTFDSVYRRYMACLSFLLHHIYYPYLYGSRLQFTPYLMSGAIVI